MFPVTPRRTADKRCVAPAPITAPAMVCVVLTGMPSALVPKSVNAPAVSALNPSNGVKCVIGEPIVLAMRQPNHYYE